MSSAGHIIAATLALELTALVGICSSAPPVDEDRFIRKAPTYQNLGARGYERYPEFTRLRPVYSRIGSYVGHGSYLVQWDEIRERYMGEKMEVGNSILDTRAQSVVFKDDPALNPFGRVSMSHEGWKGRGASFFVGRGPITTFSSLILYHTDFSGARMDFSLASNDLTLLLSRGGLSERGSFTDFDGTTSGIVSTSPVLLYGANWRGSFGALDLGSTFLRQVQSSLKGDRATLFRGDVPYPELRQPKTITVRFSDDSPQDPYGAAIYEVEVFVKVREQDQIYTSSNEATGPGAIYRADLEPVVPVRNAGDHWEVQGAGAAIDFVFSLPADLEAERVEFAATVAGDYRIGLRQVHDFENPRSGAIEQRSWPSPPTRNRFNIDFKDNPYEAEPFYTVKRAERTPALNAEPTVVRFQHAIPTAQTFYGINGQINAEALFAEAEFVLNPQDFIFPIKGGKRQRELSYAGFLTLKKDLKGIGLGAELYRIQPTYGGWYDSRRGGAVFFSDLTGDATAGEAANLQASTQEFTLYSDNDDHDPWPDDFVPVDFPYVPKGAFEGVESLGPRPEAGVYPGLDMDGDRVYDMDINRNGVGDWFEPFFAYETDPPEFVYGIDFNNNGTPDFRENDNEPDYPYRRDQRGYHLFFDLNRRPAWLDRAAMGLYRAHEIAAGGTSRGLYARVAAHATLLGVSLGLFDDIKRVEDDIGDDVYRFVLTSDTDLFRHFNTSATLPPPDPLLMRDSVVNTLFLETRYTPLRYLEIANNFKYLVNRREEVLDRQEEVLQDGRTLHNFTMVNKAQYFLQPLEALQVVLRAKHLLVKWDEESYNFRYVISDPSDTLLANPKASWSMVTPSLKARYNLTPRTRLEYGQAGFFIPALRVRFHDREDPAASYTSNISILQLTMQGIHQGYEVTTNVGVRRELVNYDAKAERPKEQFSAFFADVVFGLE